MTDAATPPEAVRGGGVAANTAPRAEEAPSAAPVLEMRRSGPQVVASGSGFEPGEALSVSIETAGQELGQPALRADSHGRFTVYGRAEPENDAVLIVRRASGVTLDTREPEAASAED